MKLFYFFTFLLFLTVNSFADINSCPGQVVASMNGITTSQSATVSGSVDKDADRYDYYYFQINAAGTLTYNYTSVKNTSLFISNSSCGGNQVLNSGTSKSGTIAITSGNTIYIEIKGESTINGTYSLDFTFTASGTPPTFAGTIPDQNATQNSAYNFNTSTYFAQTQSDAITFSTTSTLPAGITLNASGVLSGTPTVFGTYSNIVVKATDKDGFVNSNSFTLTVVQAQVAPTFSGPIPDQTANLGSTFTLNASTYFTQTNGDTITYSTSGTLPTGITLNATTGVLSGTPTVAGTYSNIIIIATDNDGATNSNNFSITATTDPVVTTNLRTFAIRNPLSTRNMRGNMVTIGNTVLCVKNNGVCYNYAGTGTNDSLDLQYIDTDSDSSTYNSSQAQLSIPATATVKWAGLYTQGYLNSNLATSTTRAKVATNLTIPSLGTLSLSPEVIDLYANGSDGYTYNTYASIPSLVGAKASSVNGWITGANIKADTGTENSGLGNFGAWTLVVVYEDQSDTLKNISVYDGYRRIANSSGFSSVDIAVSGFLTPTNGTINSTLSVFVGEGDKNIVGDKLYVGGTALNSTNAFDSSITGVTANPSYTNNQGIDIHNYMIGVDGNSSHPQIIGNNQQSATITLTSSGDTYFPSMVAFTTELYEPRVCYKQDLFDVNGAALSTVHVGDLITVQTYISNMKKDSSDGNLETADKVEITMELDNTNLEYNRSTFKMKNIGESVYYAKTDAVADDTIDFFSDTNSSKWRVGTGASATLGGQLLPNTTGSDSQKVFVTFKTKLLAEGNISINNIYKVAYTNTLLGIQFGADSPLTIGVCQDVNTSIGVTGVAGAFNAVSTTFSGTTDPLEATNALNALPTQISNQSFNVKILSLNSDNITLKAYTGDVNVSIVNTPNYISGDDAGNQLLCNNATPINTAQIVNFANTSSANLSVTNTTQATKSASFKMAYNLTTTPKYACSRDFFAIRPEKFVLSTPSGNNINLLKSAQVYGFPLKATQYGTTTATNDYNITNANSILYIVKTTYQPTNAIDASLHGTLAFATLPFQIANGDGDATIKFDDVAKVNIQLKDTTWAAIDNADTTGDCSATGSYICGDVNATFIPDHFTLSGVHLNNNTQANTFTYLSDDLNMSAHLDVTVTAKNLDDATTQNFKSASWENPVDVNISVTSAATTPTIIKDEIDATQMLGFSSGQITIPWDEPNATKKLMFNFVRDVNDSKNPFVILGSEVNLTAKSTYTNAGSTTITGSSVADLNATFIYGRSHAPRHRFSTDTNTTLLYYESYCNGCDKTLLPNGINSNITDDPRWFINTLHTNTSGNAGTVTQKNSLNIVTVNTQPVGNHPDSVGLTYNTTKGYPYKTTMENNASNWLIYNKYTPTATKNEFEVEFEGANSSWSGKHETNTTTIRSGSEKTNRRTMW